MPYTFTKNRSGTRGDLSPGHLLLFNTTIDSNDPDYFIFLKESDGFLRLGRVDFIETRKCLEVSTEILIHPSMLNQFTRVLDIVAEAV